jgi:hypothetical protein
MWLVLISALMPLVESLIEWLAGITTATTLTVPQRAAVDKIFKRFDVVRSHAIRIGIPFQSEEVQNSG